MYCPCHINTNCFLLSRLNGIKKEAFSSLQLHAKPRGYVRLLQKKMPHLVFSATASRVTTHLNLELSTMLCQVGVIFAEATKVN